MAQGAVDSLLGRLSALLIEEAQLLGGLRGDVEFIKDEMETMNGLLRHLTEAQHRDHLVRAWMKQVSTLARDCEDNVELYLHQVGGLAADPTSTAGGCLLDRLRRLLRLLRSIPARHRIAKRIRELKVRARDLGDRRKRYGITVPPHMVVAGDRIYGSNANSTCPHTATGEEEDLRRLAILFDSAHPPGDDEVVKEGVEFVINWLSKELPPVAATAAREDDGDPKVRVFSILGSELADKAATRIYEHPSLATLFGCKAWWRCDFYNAQTALCKILEEIAGVRPAQEDELTVEKVLISLPEGHLKGKLFLLVIEGVTECHEQEWRRTPDALLQAADGCHPGSAIIMTTENMSK